MSIARTLRANRTWLGLGLLGVLPLFGGCDTGDQNTKPAVPATTAAQQESERAAREKAFGKGGSPTKSSPAPEKAAEKAPEKAAEKAAEKPK